MQDRSASPYSIIFFNPGEILKEHLPNSLSGIVGSYSTKFGRAINSGNGITMVKEMFGIPTCSAAKIQYTGTRWKLFEEPVLSSRKINRKRLLCEVFCIFFVVIKRFIVYTGPKGTADRQSWGNWAAEDGICKPPQMGHG